MKRLLQGVFLALVLAAWIQAFWQHSRLPDRVASHFNAAGQANGWMTRDAQLGWHLGTITFVAAVLQGIVLLQPRLPMELINVPNRDYWFAPERRAASDAWIGGLVLAMGCFGILFFIGLFHLTYRANLTPVPRLPPVILPLSLFLLPFIGGLVAITVLRFARKPPA